jgi:hypothetical protein
MRGAVVVLLAFAFWVWASAIPVMSWYAAGAAEGGNDEDEAVLLLMLGCISWVLASGAILGLAFSRGRLLPTAFWCVQALVVSVGVWSTLDRGGVRLAPPLLLTCALLEAAGFLAITLHNPDRLHAAGR